MAEERQGKSLLRVVANTDGTYSGVVIRDGKRGKVLHDEDEARLWSRLRNEAGTLEPNYYGIEEAKARFLSFMPGGFGGERNLGEERRYKLKAHEKLNDVQPLKSIPTLGDGNAEAVLKAGPLWTNLLSPYETMHLRSALDSGEGADFLRSAAKFAEGRYGSGIAGMCSAMGRHGRLTWPIATYFPFLWNPERHMFLKPTVTCDFAERVGHPFQYTYSSELDDEVYDALLELADWTAEQIQDLTPADRIDVQSFIYVVGGYRQGDMPE